MFALDFNKQSRAKGLNEYQMFDFNAKGGKHN